MTSIPQDGAPSQKVASEFSSIEETFNYIIEATDATEAGDTYSGHCPAPDHEDKSPSFSCDLQDGRILLHCHSRECDIDDMCAGLGLSKAALFAEYYERKRATLTVADLAEMKRLPEDLLIKFNVMDSESKRYVRIPYLDESGLSVIWTRKRHAPNAKQKFSCDKGSTPVLYGLHVLKYARKQKWLIIVEGESDCWTLWHHAIPAVGVPGSTLSKVIEAAHLEGIKTIFIFREPDTGGNVFVKGIDGRLRSLGFQGEVKVVSLDGFKDPSEMHIADPDQFRDRFKLALQAARPVDEVLEEIGSTPAGNNALGGLLTLKSGASVADIQTALRSLPIGELDALDRVALRESAIKHLRVLGMKSPARMVDAVFNAKQATETESNQITFPAVEPWPEPVDGAVLLDDIATLFPRFVVLPKGANIATAPWVVFTHALDAFDIAPILAITSPDKRCGKTLFKDILEMLVARPLAASNITAAAIFRTVEKYKPTLLIDEADTFLPENEALRGVLNCGHRKSSASVIRLDGDAHEPRQFSTWSAKAIVLIGRLPDTLEDRSIVVAMKRKAGHEKVKRWSRKFENHELIIALRRRCVRWVEDHFDDLCTLDPEMPDSLNDRAQDNWRPLFAIAAVAGGKWPAKVKEAALLLSGSSAETNDNIGTQLLTDIQALFEQGKTDRLKSAAITLALGQMEGRSWPDYKHGKPITTAQLARILKRYDIKPRQLWFPDTPPTNQNGYTLDMLQDAFTRYLSRDTLSKCLETLGRPEINNLGAKTYPLEQHNSRPFETAVTDSKQSALDPLDTQQPPCPDGIPALEELVAALATAEPNVFEALETDPNGVRCNRRLN